MIQLRTLGAVELRGSDGAELRPILAQPKRFALLAYLAVNASRGFQRRDHVLALFWPEQDGEHARAALNRALYYLRRSLGEGVLLSRGDEEIGLSGEALWSDVAAFEAAAAQGRVEEAIELYRGDLLEGFFISDAPGFEEWLEGERNRLKQTAGRVAWSLAESALAAENRSLAVHWARWAAERTPYDEAGVQRLVSFLDSAGDRAGAVHAYERFARRIADDLELAPSPETRALVERIRARELTPGGPLSTTRPVGRVLERDDALATGAGGAWDPVDPAISTGAALLAEHVATGKPPGAEATATPKQLQTGRGLWVVRLSATAVVALAMAVLILVARRPEPDPRRVVVVPFANRTGDPLLDDLGHLAGSMITTNLAQTGFSEAIIPSTSVVRGLRAGPEGDQAADLRRAARASGARIVVSGAMYGKVVPDRSARTLRFEAQVVDASSAQVVWAVPSISAPADSAERALEEITERVTGAVAALMNPRFASWLPIATAPPTFQAFQEFARGTELQLSGQPEGALT
ncbi:MAG: BTAD domain-containing putative transcriptional regulator, partial [Longimicrobiales bacterium]